MSRVPANTLVTALKEKIAAILLDEDSGDEPLFNVVEPYSTSNLGDALAKLIATTKQRVCLIVPAGIRRVTGVQADGEAAHLARFLKVELIIADKAYYRAEQVALIGGDKNVGVMELFERIEEELDGVDLSDYGPVQWLAGDADTITGKELPAGRVAWFQSLLIPAGDNT